MSQQIPVGLAHHIRGMAALWHDEQRNDEQLLAAYAHAGDQSAFTTLIGRHGATVWAVCRSILTDNADAEDAFQTTFITLARMSRKMHAESGSVSGWLARVAHNAALNIHKASRRRDAAHRRLCEQTRPHSDETSSVSDDEFRVAIHEELDGLPLGLRAPLALYYLEGRTQPEIGRILGMPNQTVSYRIRKGLSVLRKRLAKRGMVVTATALVALLGGVPVALAVPPGLMASTAAAAFKAAAESAVPATSSALIGLVLSPLSKTLMIGFVVSVAVLIGFWACPPSGNTEVSGSVVMGQEPLKRAEIVLVPDHDEGRQCQAVRTFTDGDGRFRNQVAPGRYRVLVLDCVNVTPTQQIRMVPPDYRAVLHTPLRLDVGNSPVVFDIPITPVIRNRSFPEWEHSPKQLTPEQQVRLRLESLAWVALRNEFGLLEK